MQVDLAFVSNLMHWVYLPRQQLWYTKALISHCRWDSTDEAIATSDEGEKFIPSATWMQFLVSRVLLLFLCIVQSTLLQRKAAKIHKDVFIHLKIPALHYMLGLCQNGKLFLTKESMAVKGAPSIFCSLFLLPYWWWFIYLLSSTRQEVWQWALQTE